MGIPNETVLIQETDHMAMCREIDEKGKLFDILCDKLVTSQGLCLHRNHSSEVKLLLANSL